jgi:hypothetical protein
MDGRLVVAVVIVIVVALTAFAVADLSLELAACAGCDLLVVCLIALVHFKPRRRVHGL